MGMDMGMSFMGLPLVDQKHRSGQMEAVVLTCSLCQQNLQYVGAWLLPCQHLLCKDCFQGLIQELGQIAKAHGIVPDELISCPGCKRVYPTRDVTEHFFLQYFSAGQFKMARNCSECKEKRAAHILCTYCNRWLCSSCTEEHRHGPAPGGPLFSRAQKGSPGVNGGSGDFALYCPLHTQEVLKLFCETCDVLTCHSCLMVEHKEHRCRHLEEVLQNQRMLLESVTAQVAHKKSSLQTSAKQIEDRIFEVKHQHRKVENQIKMAKMVLMNELNKQANGLIEELEGITNERKRKLEQQLQSIMVLNRQFEHVQNFINWAVCSKTSVPFLFSKELIVFQMQRLLETNCNTDPGSPWSIRFTWEPNFWTKQLASLGCITTEGGQLSQADTPAYGSLQGPSSFYQSHQSPVAQQETLSHPSHKFHSSALCSSSVCCSHCSPVSPSLKGQFPPPSIHQAHSFRQPSEMVPQQLGSLQCSTLLPREKEVPCNPHPPKLLQPWLETQPSVEPESTSQRLGHQLTSQPNVDIMHHKFELEEMQKDLELLLQAQQPSLQLSQTKSPQHLQQTIVGQINYIVRQPAPVQSQSQEDTVQATDEPPASDGPKPSLSLDKNTANLPQSTGEETPHSVPSLDSTSQHSSPNVVRKSVPPASDMQLDTGADGSPGPGQAAGSLCPGDGDDPSMGNTRCKMESEDSTRCNDSLGQGPMAPGLDVSKDLAIPSELEEPINLSVKKPPVVSVVSTSVSVQQYQNPKEYENFEHGALELDTKENQSIRPYNSEPKIPYVRLERLKICATSSGEMPVFKLKPQKSDQDGSFLLIIECGTESSSMSIKVSQNNLPDAIQAPSLGGRKVTVTSVAGQQSPEVEGASPEEHRLISRAPGAKKGPPAPIENEDFCAVCLNGGELLCCDRCPKVYHLSCHLPALLSFPGGDWVCTLCRNLTQPEMEYDCENARYNQPGVRAPPGLSVSDQKKCEKLVLSLCCNSLSLPFHEPVSPLARHYYQIIKRPMDLSIIRRKLQKKDPAHYTTPEEVVSDVRLMFWNCAKFNYPDSEVAEAGRCLEVFFEGWLKEIYPEKHFAQPRQEDSDSEEVSSESGCSTPQGFPWPPYVQEGIQPKRRRRHMVKICCQLAGRRMKEQKECLSAWPTASPRCRSGRRLSTLADGTTSC
uniref:Tripartite motif-containing protein 66 n=1 Tax=Molossus molossus TaxID=27622 RepID=A0A7J8EWG9_MOLMO|nr:tripartite motif containing 66 [Molossus molossus]